MSCFGRIEAGWKEHIVFLRRFQALARNVLKVDHRLGLLHTFARSRNDRSRFLDSGLVVKWPIKLCRIPIKLRGGNFR